MKAQGRKQRTGSHILIWIFSKIAADEKALCCLRIIYPFGRRQF